MCILFQKLKKKQAYSLSSCEYVGTRTSHTSVTNGMKEEVQCNLANDTPSKEMETVSLCVKRNTNMRMQRFIVLSTDNS